MMNLIELGNIRQEILELTQSKTDYELINSLLNQYRHPSYIRAGLLILLWWNWVTWDNECCEFPSLQFFHDNWKNACKRAGVEDKEFNT